MNVKKINNHAQSIKILVAPLDWGLGHATRCIPIIYTLIKAGATVLLAGEGSIENLLRKEFPTLIFLPLKGYHIRYARHKKQFLSKLLRQTPRISKTIYYEQQWLDKVVKEHEIDAVISDNRFGLHHPGIASIYITHQLTIETGIKWLNPLTQKIHYRFINRFSQCWVPDAAGPVNLAGRLSHPIKLPHIPVKYLGSLSRFEKTVETKNIPLLVVLSGPEPQRSIFENLILNQLMLYKGKVVLVRGLPLEQATPATTANVSIYNHLPAEALCKLVLQSEMVLARAGYSSIMDLAKLQQKAILVPTPGQAEQEYLADYLSDEGLFYSCSQEQFNLKDALTGAADFYARQSPVAIKYHENVVTEWLEGVKKSKASQ